MSREYVIVTDWSIYSYYLSIIMNLKIIIQEMWLHLFLRSQVFVKCVWNEYKKKSHHSLTSYVKHVANKGKQLLAVYQL